MDYRTRPQWSAEYDIDQRPLMRLPVSHVFIHHTVTIPTDDPNADMRGIERIDIGRFGCPSYSWVIHPTGVVLEGCGVHLGAHTYANNSTSFGVSFIGNFQNDTPTDEAMQACRDLLDMLINKPVVNGLVLFGHRDVYATACPGANLYPRIGELYPGVAPTPDPTPTPSPNPTPTGVFDMQMQVIGRGSNGGQVRTFQSLAREKAGQDIMVDGDFGPKTEQAAKNIQAFTGLTVDGIVGPNTWNLIINL